MLFLAILLTMVAIFGLAMFGEILLNTDRPGMLFALFLFFLFVTTITLTGVWTEVFTG